ncbi:MAG TPA: hypothetical protein VK674_02180 [Candidatus Limnocylindria bacterium]|nr:hypothetical protein [Candidatus Limnocylindria bacterium]
MDLEAFGLGAVGEGKGEIDREDRIAEALGDGLFWEEIKPDELRQCIDSQAELDPVIANAAERALRMSMSSDPQGCYNRLKRSI